MRTLDAYPGVRVRSKVDFVSVPAGTEGVIDDTYPGGVMVAWDLPDRPLPPGYRVWDGRPSFAPGTPLRDGFGDEELKWLEPIPERGEE